MPRRVNPISFYVCPVGVRIPMGRGGNMAKSNRAPRVSTGMDCADIGRNGGSPVSRWRRLKSKARVAW
jgi:hypothetical protein